MHQEEIMKWNTRKMGLAGLLLVPVLLLAQEPKNDSAQLRDNLPIQKIDSAPGHPVQLLSQTAEPQDKQSKKEPPKDYVLYDTAPEAVNQVEPKYPELALRAGLEGLVWTNVWISETGDVVEAKVIKSEAEIFNQAALDAAKQWKFKPATANGKPVATWVAIPFKFKLAEKPRLEGTGKLLGNVRDKDSGEPIPEVSVVVVGTAMAAVTDGLGRYSLSGIRSGMATIVVAAVGYAPMMLANVVLKPGVTTTLNFLLKKEVSEEKLQYDDAPEATNQVNPKYPYSAMKDGLEGDVVTKVWLDEAGNVTKVEVTKSLSKDLDEAAVAAVKQWKFKAAKKNGKPIAVWITIPFRFKIAAY